MHTNNDITKVFQEKVQQPYIEFKKKHQVVAGFLSLVVVLLIAVVSLISGKTKSARAGASESVEIAAPQVSGTPSGDTDLHSGEETHTHESFEVAIASNDNVPLAAGSHIPASPVGVSKRPEVNLTDDMAELAMSISKFMEKNNKYAILTSGVRSGESQLEIIKQRIEEKGGAKKHAGIFNATLQDTNVWVKAWNWLRAKRVPVNPPGDIRGKGGQIVRKSSDHLKGKAMDLISPNLKDLHRMLVKYAASKEAKQQDLRIRAVVLEPYCVHIALG